MTDLEPPQPTEGENKSARVSLLLYVIAFFVVWTLRATVLYRIDEGIESSLWRAVYSNAVKLAVWVIPVFLTLSLVEKLRPGIYLKLNTSVDTRGLMISMLVVLLFLTGVVLVEAKVQDKTLSQLLGHGLTVWLGTLVSVFFSPICEEILFRGFFLNRFNESIGFWRANAVSSLLFMLAHVPYWVSHNGLSAQVLKDLANVFVLGCLFGWVMKRSNSLWPAIGAHIGNNLLSGLIHT